MAWQNYMRECKEYFENNPVEIEGESCNFTQTLTDETLYLTWFDEAFFIGKRAGHYNSELYPHCEIVVVPPLPYIENIGLMFEGFGEYDFRVKNYYLTFETFPGHLQDGSLVFCVPIISKNYSVILHKLVNPYKQIISTKSGVVIEGDHDEQDFF